MSDFQADKNCVKLLRFLPPCSKGNGSRMPWYEGLYSISPNIYKYVTSLKSTVQNLAGICPEVSFKHIFCNNCVLIKET